VPGKCFERHCHRSKLNSWHWQNSYIHQQGFRFLNEFCTRNTLLQTKDKIHETDGKTGSCHYFGYFLNWTRILSGIQFTTYIIVFFVVEMKRFSGSTVNVILTRQTCGQLSSSAAESKRRALAWELKIIFPGEVAICSLCQNVEETGI